MLGYRKRINEVFDNKDSKCYILLKDRGKIFKNHLEEEWYEMAYGKKRNIMKFRMTLPIPDGVKFATKLHYFAEVSYQMFPEHAKEFANQTYKNNFILQLPQDEYSTNLYEKEIELPFGTVSAELKYKEDGIEDDKYHEVTVVAIKQAFKCHLEPVPISAAD